MGRGVAGNGGSVTTFWAVGKIGDVGFGKDGTWVLGIGGSVGFTRVGCVGNVGKGEERSGGNVVFGRVWNEGNRGNVALGKDGIVGSVNAGDAVSI